MMTRYYFLAGPHQSRRNAPDGPDQLSRRPPPPLGQVQRRRRPKDGQTPIFCQRADWVRRIEFAKIRGAIHQFVRFILNSDS
jgi:hypothetical protein